MDNINARVENTNHSQVEKDNNTQARTAINSQADDDKSPRVETPNPPTVRIGRPRKYADKSEAMKAYRTRVTKLQQEYVENLNKLTTPILSDFLVKALRILPLAKDAPKTTEQKEAHKLAGRIVKVLRGRYKLRLE